MLTKNHLQAMEHVLVIRYAPAYLWNHALAIWFAPATVFAVPIYVHVIHLQVVHHILAPVFQSALALVPVQQVIGIQIRKTKF